MSHRRLAAVAAAAAGLALAATPTIAHAAPTNGPPPLTVLVGGNSAVATYNVQGVNKGDVVLTADDVPLDCTTSTLNGTVTSGPYSMSPAHVADINSATFTSCTLDGSFAATVTPSDFPWALNISNVTGSNSADGNVTGINAGVDVNVLGVDCSFDVTGTVNGSIDVQSSGVQELTTTSDQTLTLSNVSAGCLGQVTNGSPASFQGAYDLTVLDSAGNPIANPPISFTNP